MEHAGNDRVRVPGPARFRSHGGNGEVHSVLPRGACKLELSSELIARCRITTRHHGGHGGQEAMYFFFGFEPPVLRVLCGGEVVAVISQPALRLVTRPSPNALDVAIV